MQRKKTFVSSREKQKRCLRSGGGFAFATLSSITVMPVILLMSFGLINLGLYSYYNHKVSIILKQVANRCVNLKDQNEVHDYAQRLSVALCKASGLRCVLPMTGTNWINDEGAEGIEISFQGLFPLIPGTSLPSLIPVKQKVFVATRVNKRFAEASFYAYPFAALYPARGPSVFAPVTRPADDFPVWSFRPDQTIGSVHLIEGDSPVVPLRFSARAYFKGRESLY